MPKHKIHLKCPLRHAWCPPLPSVPHLVIFRASKAPTSHGISAGAGAGCLSSPPPHHLRTPRWPSFPSASVLHPPGQMACHADRPPCHCHDASTPPTSPSLTPPRPGLPPREPPESGGEGRVRGCTFTQAKDFSWHLSISLYKGIFF